MLRTMIYPHRDRMKANPNYQVRVPHEPWRRLSRNGERVPHTAETERLIRAGDVETEDQRKAKRSKKRKAKKG